ncbi:MAG: hypothetical protein ACLPY5_16670 [Candidatus Bathyarchaeia archaeon]
MQTHGISRRDYERLPLDTKQKSATTLETIKAELRHRGFTLKFLGFDGRWKDLTPWKFLAFSEDNHRRLIAGAKWLRPRAREDILEKLAELYELVRQLPKVEEKSLEYWSKET